LILINYKQDFHFVKGRPTTTGYVSRRNFRPEQDSALIKTLRDAGAVFYCKTTMPQSGMAIETVSNLWGRTLNPYNTALSAGGSSGGDAVLVALKGTPVTPSTDLGGSIRVPAAFNGLYAIRPTSDRIPKGGMENINNGQLSIKLSCGPICHSMEDLEAFTKVINSHPSNQHDPTSVPMPWRSSKLSEDKLTIGLMKWDKVVMPHPPVLRALEHTKRALENAGHKGMFHIHT
jgi:amidase